MPRRTLTFGKITVNEFRVSESDYDLDDIDGLDLLSEFSNWVEKVPKDHFTDAVKHRFGTKPEVTRFPRFTLVSMRTGHYGTAGNLVIDVSNHGTKYKTGIKDSSTVETRCGLLVPPGGKTALYFSEHQGHDSCGSRIFSSFEAHLKETLERNHTSSSGDPLRVTVKRETLVSGAAWIKAAGLERVTALKYDKSTDISDSPIPTELVYSRTIEPPKGVRHLPDQIKHRIFGGSVTDTSFLGFPTDEEFDALEVQLGRDGQTKRMYVGREKSPAIRKMLNDDGQPSFDDPNLIRSFEEDAKSFYETQGLNWSYTWTRNPKS